MTESSRGPAYVLKKHLEGLLPKNRTGDAAIGAIARDTGKGVGVGLEPGPLRALCEVGMQQRQTNAAAQKQAAAQTAAKQQKDEEELKAAHAEGSDTFSESIRGLHGRPGLPISRSAPPRAYSRCVGLLAFVDRRPKCWRKG